MCAWIKATPTAADLVARRGGYGPKHAAERQTRRYIGNGASIPALSLNRQIATATAAFTVTETSVLAKLDDMDQRLATAKLANSALLDHGTAAMVEERAQLELSRDDSDE